jgi:uncharacterized protein YndB with AHSA1/START domain
MSSPVPDRIERQIVVKAPRARVWRALTDADEFASWFLVDMKGHTFAPGGHVRGQVKYPGYEHLAFEVHVERMEPERLFSWRWHPGAVQADDVKDEPMTLVVFELEDVPEGTLVKVTESGFDRLSLARRAKAFQENEGGWAEVTENLARHVAGHP